jgi:tRNA threonylcarbamoyladenosine biosynthesis protein TsaE
MEPGWALEVELADAAATRAAGRALGEVLAPGDAVALVGDLGAGKTPFVQGVAAGAGVPAEVPVTSPSFALVSELPGGRLPLVHADLYRLERARELDELGLDDQLGGAAAVLVEWADRFAVLPRDQLRIELTVAGAGRRLRARGEGPAAAARAAAWAHRLAC